MKPSRFSKIIGTQMCSSKLTILKDRKQRHLARYHRRPKHLANWMIK